MSVLDELRLTLDGLRFQSGIKTGKFDADKLEVILTLKNNEEACLLTPNIMRLCKEEAVCVVIKPVPIEKKNNGQLKLAVCGACGCADPDYLEESARYSGGVFCGLCLSHTDRDGVVRFRNVPTDRPSATPEPEAPEEPETPSLCCPSCGSQDLEERSVTVDGEPERSGLFCRICNTEVVREEPMPDTPCTGCAFQGDGCAWHGNDRGTMVCAAGTMEVPAEGFEQEPAPAVGLEAGELTEDPFEDMSDSSEDPEIPSGTVIETPDPLIPAGALCPWCGSDDIRESESTPGALYCGKCVMAIPRDKLVVPELAQPSLRDTVDAVSAEAEPASETPAGPQPAIPIDTRVTSGGWTGTVKAAGNDPEYVVVKWDRTGQNRAVKVASLTVVE